MIRSSIRRAVSNPSAKVPEVLPEWAVEKRTSLSLFFDRFSGKMQRLATKTIALSDKFMGIQPKECLYRVPRLLKVHGKRPTVKDNCFIAPSALVTGDVRVGRKNYIGYNCIIRANDGESILMGESCNIQEKAVVTGNTTIGKWATVEPMAIIDSSDIASCSFVGASAIVMKGCRMESGSMLCAASVLQAGSIIPSGEMWSGNPAQKVADLSEKEREEIVKSAKHMVLLAIEHHDSWELTWEELEDQREGREQFARYAENNRELRMKAMYMKEPPRPNRKAMGRKTPKEVADGGENKPSMMGSHIEGY